MQVYHLHTEFVDGTAEQALLASIIQNRSLYFELLDELSSGIFLQEDEAWNQITCAMESDRLPEVPAHWHPAVDPHATVQHLMDLSQRRLLAGAHERLAQALFDETAPITTVMRLWEEETLRVQTALCASTLGTLQWASALLPQVLTEAETRRHHREVTGTAVLGAATGLSRLDDLLGGLTTGLYLLAGPPGGGKTTLALQFATAIACALPVVFVTFEHSPANLILKALCARAGLNPQQIQRGLIALDPLQRVALEWHPVAARLAFLEGGSHVTVAQLRTHVQRVMHQHHASQCLVVVDYLQLWAKVADEWRQDRVTVRERVELLGGALREFALRLQSPVVALASQNRAQGHYGNGKGLAALDSLKESGDLEYTADVVLFLTESGERTALAPARAVDLTVAKNRHGDTGRVALIFRPDLGILREEASP